MKKSIHVLAVSLTVVLCLSLSLALFFISTPKENFKPTTCLTDAIDETMSMREISVHYESACVAVLAESFYKRELGGNASATSLGSGVCIASIDYQTSSGYKVAKGSYFVTNYHVIKYAVDTDFTSTFDTQISIVPDDSSGKVYPASLLWASRELDAAILFCNKQIDGLNYVKMKDRTIACSAEERLRRDDVFTQGTPLNLSFLNTYAEGYVSNSKTMSSSTTKKFYYKGNTDGVIGTANKAAISGSYYETTVEENIYDDLIMLNLDITNGNSGGGLFDKQGYLVGLTTLGLDHDGTNGAAMNFAVPIYSVKTILDTIIENNENSLNQKIYSYQNLGLSVYDATMAYSAVEHRNEKNNPFYYIDGQVVQDADKNKLNFTKSGVYVYKNNKTSALSFLPEGSVITKAENSFGEQEIKDRNDLIYFLLNCKKNDKISITYYKSTTSLLETVAKDIVL